MINNLKYRFLFLLSFGFIYNQMYAQQLPFYSQYLLNDYAYNPSIAGSRPYFDVKSNHRYQWVGITDSPRTYTLSINGPTKNRKMGLGGFLYTDHVGPTRRTGFQFSYAYHFNMSDKIRLSLSLSAGLIEWKLDAHKITLYDPSDQVIVNSVMRAIAPDAKFGFLLYHDNWFFGGAAPNLIRSKLNFSNSINTGLSRLENHFYLHGGYTFDLSEDLVIEPSFMVKFVSPAPIQLDLMSRIVWKKQLWLGVAYRTMDAASAMIGYVFKQNLLLGYSYDFTTSNLRNYSSGTHELMIGVRFVRNQTFELPSTD